MMSLYEPSAHEQLWYSESAKGRICALTGAQIEGVLTWLRFASHFHGDARQRFPPLATLAEQAVLSRFARGSQYDYIEPLTGIARHPLTPIWGCARKARAGGSNATLRTALSKFSPTGVLDPKYIVPANRCGQPRPPRSFFFDLGTSVPGDDWGEAEHSSYGGIPPSGSKADRARQAAKRAAAKSASAATPKAPPTGVSSVHAHVIDGKLVAYDPATKARGANGAAVEDLEGIGLSSLTFFSRLYAANCLAFDRIYAWEAAPYDAAIWWRHVPLPIRAKLTFFNLAAESTPGSLHAGQNHASSGPHSDRVDERAPASGSGGPGRPPASRPSPSDPLALIQATARPADFVVLKVDIDGGPELELVSRIADNEGGLASLVDELYFEYHFCTRVRQSPHAPRPYGGPL